MVAAESASWVCALHVTSCVDLCLICCTTLLIKKFDLCVGIFRKNDFNFHGRSVFENRFNWSVSCWYIVCICCLIALGKGISRTLHSVILVLPVTASFGAGLEMETTICFKDLIFRIKTETENVSWGGTCSTIHPCENDWLAPVSGERSYKRVRFKSVRV